MSALWFPPCPALNRAPALGQQHCKHFRESVRSSKLVQKRSLKLAPLHCGYYASRKWSFQFLKSRAWIRAHMGLRQKGPNPGPLTCCNTLLASSSIDQQVLIQTKVCYQIYVLTQPSFLSVAHHKQPTFWRCL